LRVSIQTLPIDNNPVSEARLHQEIEDFVKFMELTPEEVAFREEVVDRVREMLRNSSLERFDPDVS
jgi:DNA polymerase sigma